MDLQFTAVFRKVPEGYIAFVEEFAGANTQGATLEEARTNLHEAVIHEPSDDDEIVVLESLRRGYLWNGRVVRPAMVKVKG